MVHFIIMELWYTSSLPLQFNSIVFIPSILSSGQYIAFAAVMALPNLNP